MTENKPILYFAPSTCARVTLTALEEIGIPFETRLIAFMAGEHRKPEYLAINAAGKVPALQTKAGVLTQNGAILLYLARTYSESGLLPLVSRRSLVDPRRLSGVDMVPDHRSRFRSGDFPRHCRSL